MAKQKIKTRSWVMFRGELTEVKDLPPEYQMYLGAWIRAETLNVKYAGTVVFYPTCPDPREKEEHITGKQHGG